MKSVIPNEPLVTDESIHIRRAIKSDRATLLEMHTALYIDHRDHVVPKALIPLVAYQNFKEVLSEDIDAMLHSNNFAVLIAEQKNENHSKVIGYITGHTESDARRLLSRRGIVGDWYIVKELRGLGAGRMLIDTLTQIFIQAGCSIMESATWATNHDARVAHTKLGFSEIQMVYRKRLTPNE